MSQYNRSQELEQDQIWRLTCVQLGIKATEHNPEFDVMSYAHEFYEFIVGDAEPEEKDPDENPETEQNENVVAFGKRAANG